MIPGTHSRRDRLLARQLPEAAAEMARLVDSGATLTRSLEEVARWSPPPLGDELDDVMTDITYGSPVWEALHKWLVRSGRSDVMLLVVACRLGSTEGGNLVVALDGVSAALHDALELGEEAAALTSQARTSAVVLMTLPFLGLFTFCVLEPSIVAFVFGTPAGWLLLVTGTVLDAVGAIIMMTLVRWSLR